MPRGFRGNSQEVLAIPAWLEYATYGSRKPFSLDAASGGCHPSRPALGARRRVAGRELSPLLQPLQKRQARVALPVPSTKPDKRVLTAGARGILISAAISAPHALRASQSKPDIANLTRKRGRTPWLFRKQRLCGSTRKRASASYNAARMNGSDEVIRHNRSSRFSREEETNERINHR